MYFIFCGFSRADKKNHKLNMFSVKEYLDGLPSNAPEIDLMNVDAEEIPDLSRFTNLQYLYCNNNRLTRLPNLPNTLIELYCSENQLVELPELPPSLRLLHCGMNKLTSLPNMSAMKNLEVIYCGFNNISQLPFICPENNFRLLQIFFDETPASEDKTECSQIYKSLNAIQANFVQVMNDLYSS